MDSDFDKIEDMDGTEAIELKPAGETGQADADLLRALVDLMNQSDGQDGMTNRDIQDALHIRERKVLELLRDLDNSGKLEVVMVKRRTIARSFTTRPAYRLKSE